MPIRRVFRTADAIEDLDSLWDNIAHDNPSAADGIVDELSSYFELLLKFPEIGELQKSLADGTFRRSVVRNFVVYYRPVETGIIITRVFHGAQDHEQLL